MARCAAAMPLGAFPHIGGISLSRSSTWDLGRNDADPQIGGAPSVGDEEPNGQRSLDNRVRWAKQEQADNWGNGHTQCLFVSLHTQGSGEPALRGVFRVLDPDQALKIPSSSLGASALAGPARELGWYSSSAYVRWEPIQVLHMVSKVLTEDTDRDGQAFKDTLQALEPDDPAMRGPMPAVLLELGHHSNTWHPLGDPNYFDLCDHRLRLRIGVGVVGGVDEWIKLNGPYWER